MLSMPDNYNQSNQEQFFDAESDSGSDSTSYDRILILQMRKCVEVLSMDRKSCMTRIKMKGMIEETQIKDIDELIINHVDTLRVLMNPFLTEVKDDVPKILNIQREIESLDDNLMNKVIIMPTGHRQLLQDMPMPEGHPLIAVAKQKKSKLYRKMFEYLIKSYHDNEEKIKSYSYE
jgi:hypothetical protein